MPIAGSAVDLDGLDRKQNRPAGVWDGEAIARKEAQVQSGSDMAGETRPSRPGGSFVCSIHASGREPHARIGNPRARDVRRPRFATS